MFGLPGGGLGVLSIPGSSVTPANNDYSMGFRGGSGAIVLGQPADFDIEPDADDFTVNAWVRYRTGTAFQRCIFSKARMNGGAVTIFVGVADTTGAAYVLCGGGENTSGGDVSDGDWHMVTVTGAAGSIKLYVDGSQVGSTFSAGTAQNTTDDWLIGGARYDNNTDISYPLIGQVNEFSMWTVCLTGGQVAELYNGGVPIDVTSHSQGASAPHYYHCGVGDVIPTITDQVGSQDASIQMPSQVYLFKDSPTHTASALDALSTGFSRDLFFDATSYAGSGDWSADAGGWTGVVSGTPVRQVTSQFSGLYEVTTAGSTWFRLGDHADHAITSSTAVTYCIRMYTGAENGTGGFYLGYDAGSTVADLQVYNFFYDKDAAARIRQASGTDYLTCESHDVQNQNKYITVHVVVDIPNTTLKVYVNGGLVISDSTPTGSFTTATTAPLGILGNAYLGAGGFNSGASGQAIMQVVRYRQVLTDNEIAQQAAVFNALKGYV
jgi:hypothetical protein